MFRSWYDDFMRYVIHYDVAAIVIFIFILLMIAIRKGFNKLSNRWFFIATCIGLLSAVTDIISTWYICHPMDTSLAVLDFWNYVYLAIHNSMPVFFLFYLIALTDLHLRMQMRHWVILYIPIVISFATLLSNPFSHAVFYYDENRIYTHGPQFLILYVIAVLYMILSIVLVVRLRKALPIQKVIATVICISLCLVSVILQNFFPSYLIEIFFQSIGMITLLLTIENDDEVTNRMTNVYNRYAFLQDVERALVTGNPLHIITVKLYNYNYTNSTFGVQYMSAVMHRIAEWLDYLVRGADCYDCNNGHFALVIHGGDREELLEAVEQIRDRFDEEWVFQSMNVTFPAQVCLLEIPTDISSIEQIMLIMDVPVNDNTGRSQIVTSNAMHSYQREVVIEHKIREALEQGKFQVFYQPLYDIATGKISCAEALLRLHDEELGFISPDEFIPIAERNGSILDLGAYVIDETCRFYAVNHLDMLGIRFVDVNLSVVQCMNHRLPQTIQNILDANHLPPQRINLEITESAGTGNQSALEETVRLLSDQGFSIALDDYGIGYSNYSYMFALPFSFIKIDKSILWSALDTNNHPGTESAMILLENTIRMLKQMQYRVVVEGVETEAQRDLLTDIGCDYLQGYLFSRPLPGDQFVEFVRMFNA